MNRREWSKRLVAALAVIPAVAAQVTQKVPPVGSPAPPIGRTTPQERVQKAYADVRAVSDQLSKIEVPMDVEPAFAFKA